MNKTLYRDSSRKFLGGVAAGLSDYWHIDITMVRILFLLAGFMHHYFGHIALVVYILLWIILPDKKNLVTGTSAQGFTMPPSGNPDEFEANYKVEDFSSSGTGSTNQATAPMPDAFKTHEERNRIGGIILIVLGALFLIQQNIPWDWDFNFLDDYWPIGLILIGVLVMIGANKSKPKSI